MARASKPPFGAIDLPNDEAARRVAEEIARRTGYKVVVKDVLGKEVASEEPPRPNCTTVPPKS